MSFNFERKRESEKIENCRGHGDHQCQQLFGGVEFEDGTDDYEGEEPRYRQNERHSLTVCLNSTNTSTLSAFDRTRAATILAYIES